MYKKKKKTAASAKGGAPKPKTGRSKRVAGRAVPGGRGTAGRRTRRTGSGGYSGG